MNDRGALILPMPIPQMPVGVRVLQSASNHAEAPAYRGVSYCDAVRRAGERETLRVLPGSFRTCRWAPVVLGLKEPEGRFERGLTPRLSFPVGGLLLAPLDRFPGEPDVVVVQTTAETLGRMIEMVGRDWLWNSHGDRLNCSALTLFTSERTEPRLIPHPLRRGLIGTVNRVLAPLARLASWQALTRWLFRSRLVTASFDTLISRTLADMSVCRNSTVIPMLTGQVNASFFCTGGITWGRNDPNHLTSGWPWPDFRRVWRVERWE